MEPVQDSAKETYVGSTGGSEVGLSGPPLPRRGPLVSSSLVDYQDDGRVVVWWPNRKRGKRWVGTIVTETETAQLAAGPGPVPTESSKCAAHAKIALVRTTFVQVHAVYVYVCMALAQVQCHVCFCHGCH